MTILTNITGVLLMLVCSLPVYAEPRQYPVDCSPKQLSIKRDDVIPCYLSSKEAVYDWQVKSTTQEKVVHNNKTYNVSVHSLELTSLRWQQGERDKVNHPVWKHRLTVYEPENIVTEMALLYVNGGTLYPKEPNVVTRTDDLEFARMAGRTGSLVIDLKDVPNQSLTFANTGPLVEDDLIAYTWSRFLMDPVNNYDWLLRLPMVKSVVSAMDASQSFALKNKRVIKDFVVAGGSKRGWTAWLVAAMDKRTSALVPMVADFLNLPKMMEHLFNVYKEGNPAIAAYMPLKPLIGSEPMNRLVETVDPFQYLKLLTLPKYIVSASGDNFVPNDNSRFFYDALQGDKWMRVLPNRSHYIVREDKKQVSDILESFHGAFIHRSETPLPEFTYHLSGSILQLKSSSLPKSAKLWVSTNKKTWDFRKADDNRDVSSFSSSALNFRFNKNAKDKSKPYELNLELSAPEEGWSASFVEVSFANQPEARQVKGHANNQSEPTWEFEDLIFTSRVFVLPDRYPEKKSDKTNAEGNAR